MNLWKLVRAGSAVTCWTAAAAIGVLGACSSSEEDDPPLTPADAGREAGAFGDGSLTGDARGDAACASFCSEDLRSRLDCHGNVLETCGENGGCAGDACVPPCDAAAANKSSVGCDFATFDPDTLDYRQGGCFAAFIVSAWGTPAALSVEYDGKAFDAADFAYLPSGSGRAMTYAPLPEGRLPPGQVAVLFLASVPGNEIDCPSGVRPLVAGDAAAHGTGYGKAFRVHASVPVAAYDIYPYGGGNSQVTAATLLLPISAWDTNYVGVEGYSKTPFGDPWIAIVGAEDGTEVTLSPTSAIVGSGAGAGADGGLDAGLETGADGGVGATGKGVPRTYTVNRGQVLQFVQSGELTGTPIQATKPIAVFGGHTCMNVPSTSTACDAAHQQIPPVPTLGYEYVAVRHRDRYPGWLEESEPWRIIGAVDGTKLTYDPKKPTAAPDTLESGQMFEFRAMDPFVVKAQDKDHPFYMAAYMTGSSVYTNGLDARGDPEFVNVIPPQQYMSAYTFFTDPTYPETHLVVVRKQAGGAFAPVSLDCAGELQNWTDVGDYQWTRLDLVTGNFQPVGGCDNGLHRMTSTGPFGLTVWGWGSGATVGFDSQAVSYAYPGGANLRPITPVVVKPDPK